MALPKGRRMIRILITYTGLEGMPAVNTLHFAGTGQTAANEAAVKANNFVQAMKIYISSSVQITIDQVATEVNFLTGEIVAFYGISGTATVGTDSNQPLPIGTSLLCTFQTGNVVRGRRLQGRIYVPGMTEGLPAPTTGTLAPASVVTLSGVLANTLGGTGAQFLVWSRPVVDGPDGQVGQVTQYGVSRILSNLRSRRR